MTDKQPETSPQGPGQPESAAGQPKPGADPLAGTEAATGASAAGSPPPAKDPAPPAGKGSEKASAKEPEKESAKESEKAPDERAEQEPEEAPAAGEDSEPAGKSDAGKAEGEAGPESTEGADLPPVATDCWPTEEKVGEAEKEQPAEKAGEKAAVVAATSKDTEDSAASYLEIATASPPEQAQPVVPATVAAAAAASVKTPVEPAAELATATDQPVAVAVAEEEVGRKPLRVRGKHAAPRHRIWNALWFIPEPMSDRWWRSWFMRSLLLLTGVLLLTGLFVGAYVGALHNPVPKNVPVGVIKGDAPAHQLLATLRQRSDALQAVEYSSADAASSALEKRRVYAVLTFTTSEDAPGAGLTVATAGGPSAVLVITETLTTAADAASIPLTVTDVAPLDDEDPHGLSPFYLVVGWVVGGYLAATVLALSTGTVPRNFERAAMRLGALALFSALAGFAGALIVTHGLHIWPDHLLGLTVTGALTVFASAAAASALSGWLGMTGTGVAIFLFVILGNPGSGGIYAPELLPRVFRGLHNWVLPGLGTDLARSVAYFDGKGPGRAVTGLVLYAAAGVIGLLLATTVLGKRGNR
ncbi:hypothetical protein [Longispora albida]|uniref:hypothetical protein n=1 Tax=Longispora albida TaxID=203523 RepID=UPI0003697172|nr:hypothetical protein [Longispora albida]